MPHGQVTEGVADQVGRVVDDAVEAVVADDDLEEVGVDGKGDVEVVDNNESNAQATSCDYRQSEPMVLQLRGGGGANGDMKSNNASEDEATEFVFFTKKRQIHSDRGAL